MKEWHSYKFLPRNRNKQNSGYTTIEAKETYYRIASHFLYDHKFDTDTEKTIWSLHVEGIGVRDIAQICKKTGVPMYAEKVQRIITKLREAMKDES